MKTSCLAPVLPSMIVTVVVLGGAPAPGGDVGAGADAACCSVAADEGCGCGGAGISDAFTATRRFAGTTAIGSPPNGSSVTTAQSANRPRNAASAPAMICG